MCRIQRGDTIVEVIVSFTIFSMLAVAGLALMNQGTATAQRTLEISLVRQQIDSQADALRYVNRELVAGNGNARGTWTAITSKEIDGNLLQSFDSISDSERCIMPAVNQNAFAIDLNRISDFDSVPSDIPLLLRIESAETYARIDQIAASGSVIPQGVWIVAVKGDNNANYHDFHIRACWISPGQGTPMKLGTIVRLYEPQT